MQVTADRVLIFGDLHLSCTYEGKHISYVDECYDNMLKISEICKENKPDCIIFLGDIVGVRERNIKDRQFLMCVMKWLISLNDLTKGNVYSVKGNHDIGDFSDFDFLIGMGIIKNPDFLDTYSSQGTFEIRYHFVNYGHEHEALNITNEASNVVLGHNNYYIEGLTNFYSSRKSNIEVSQLGNFCGIDYIISGHIHIPSEQVLYSVLKDGKNIGVFYTGSPSRTFERYDDCWYILFESSVQEGTVYTDFKPHLMGIKPCDEIFYPDEDFAPSYEDEEEYQLSEENSEKLTKLVAQIIEGRIATGDIVGQIRNMPIADEETKNLAIKYYEEAERG